VRLGATLARLSPAPPIAVAEWARRLVGDGFASLWVHQVIGRGHLVPDPFVTLAVAATVTEGVELGTATVQVPLFHPADLAYRVLSLVSVCGARLSLGVSPGSAAADFAALDRGHAARFRTFDQNLARLRVLLARGRDERADLAPAPGVTPPLLLGSWGANVEKAAREFDGWLASDYRRTPDQIVAAHERYRAAGGRRAIVCAIRLSGRDDLGPTGERLHRYAEAGFDDAVVVIDPGGPDPEQVRALVPEWPSRPERRRSSTTAGTRDTA
jgi:alkanesulfonate monooxygenase SsuD/methylene tetrahydromethanopterin reductase-like flavin-dependent oxidoreductase (luciferase family)